MPTNEVSRPTRDQDAEETEAESRHAFVPPPASEEGT